MKPIDLNEYYYKITAYAYMALQNNAPLLDVNDRVTQLMLGALRLSIRYESKYWRDVHLRLDGYGQCLVDMYTLPNLVPNVGGKAVVSNNE